MRFWAAKHPHKLNHQIKLPSSLPPSSLGTPPPHSEPESSHFPASLWPWRPCEGLSWPQKEPPGIQAPQTPAQLSKGRAEVRKQTVSSTLWKERGQVGAGGVLEDISGFCLCPQQPHSPAHFFQLSLSSPGLAAFPPFSAPSIPSFQPAGIPQRRLLSREQNGWQQGEGLGALDGFPSHPSAG